MQSLIEIKQVVLERKNKNMKSLQADRQTDERTEDRQSTKLSGDHNSGALKRGPVTLFWLKNYYIEVSPKGGGSFYGKHILPVA